MWRNSHASNIFRAIKEIRENFKAPLAVPVVAKAAGMGVSSFHTHFKAITGTTPLQYQKDLRLMEAKQILMAGRHSVSSAAFEVGYESPTQFSREYKRKFGHSPATDQIASNGTDLSIMQSGNYSGIAN
jgi:transcriptional regulator GlxA family with amidase domain